MSAVCSPSLMTMLCAGAVVLFAATLPAQESHPPQVLGVDSIDKLPARIAFGSCGHQNKPQPILKTVVAQSPNLFIYLGDNIYGDTKDMNVLSAKYEKLAAKKEFQKLRSNVPVLSVWDDHDYGWNDSGKEYEFKQESKEIFMDFWKVPQDSPRRRHAGIYGSHKFTKEGKTLQVILLDTRTFRDRLKRNRKPVPEESGFKNDYQPDSNPEKTILGTAQWKWLKSVLEEEADLRIICSSIQFGHQYNGWESWTNLPLERERMVKLIKETQANGVVFISGDVHWAEISKREPVGQYPLYDVTASGLTEEWSTIEPNVYRVNNPYRKNHFGMLEIDWDQKDPTITMKIIDIDGKAQIENQVHASDLSF